MRDEVFYPALLGFVGGVLFASFIHADAKLLFLAGLITLALFFIFSFIFRSRLAVAACLFILLFAAGAVRFQAAGTNLPEAFEKIAGTKVSLIGTVVDEPEQRQNSIALTVEVKEGGEKARVLVGEDLGGEFAYGDKVEITGVLKHPENFETDQGKTFDYVNYLRKDGILYVMQYPKTKVISSGGGSRIKRALFSVKEKFLTAIHYNLPTPENIFLGGLVLGEKSSFSQEMRQEFVNTGTIHIIALSGYNITIVANWFRELFSFLAPAFAAGAGILSIILFVLMTGAGSTAVRAGIMAVLAILARTTGREYDAGRALLFAGAAMVLLNPLILAFDVSFQLSFLATVAVIFLTPRIEKYFLWVPNRFGLQGIAAVTTAAYIFVLPFILYEMGTFSLVALPTNFLVLPFIPATMALGFGTGIAGILSRFLVAPFAWITYVLLHLELGIIGLFARLPLASFTIPHFPLVATILLYALLMLYIFGRNIALFFKGF
jgi:competence protein ComEC